MTSKQYPVANLTEKELKKLQDAEKAISNLAGRSEDQEIVLVAYRHEEE